MTNVIYRWGKRKGKAESLSFLTVSGQKSSVCSYVLENTKKLLQ